MKQLIRQVFSKKDLSEDQAFAAMNIMMTGQALPEEIAAFLGALRGKGEASSEIVGFARSMRSHATRLPIKRKDLLDTCGTGGSGLQTFNISTIVAFILAASGVGVVKHGNRSISGKCGSADVLEALGVKIDLPVDLVARAVDQIGFGFLFARVLHPAMKHVAPIRTNIGVPTVFNLLGPITNPAFCERQIVGVYDENFVKTIAESLKLLGSKEAFVLRGDDGMDEVTLTGYTQVAHLAKNHVQMFRIGPEDFGFKKCDQSALRGGGVKENTDIFEGILTGKIYGPKRDIVLSNASCALIVAKKVDTYLDGVKMAAEKIDTGQAYKVLEAIKKF